MNFHRSFSNFILGNHDYKTPKSKEMIYDALTQNNIKLLVNEKINIHPQFELLAVGDTYAKTTDCLPHKVNFLEFSSKNLNFHK